jgi:hypothetical protein
MTHHDDDVKVAPDVYKVLLENDEVRVLEARLKQGAKSEMHSSSKCGIFLKQFSSQVYLPRW